MLVVYRGFEPIFICERTYIVVLSLLSLRRLFFASSPMSLGGESVIHYKKHGLVIDVKNFPREGNNAAFNRKAYRM
jgi:hypothetical protein